MPILWFTMPDLAPPPGKIGPAPTHVGVAARACGLDRDVRRDFPYGIYRLAHIPVVTWNTGDVFARACAPHRTPETALR